MKSASLNEIRNELGSANAGTLRDLCLRLARYKIENKELLTYLLFEAQDEQGYIGSIRNELDILFDQLPRGNVYYVKKSVRKILRFVNKYVRYSGIAGTELDIRIYFCAKLRAAGVPVTAGTVLGNMYRQQLKKIDALYSRIPEDLRLDYERDYRALLAETGDILT